MSRTQYFFWLLLFPITIFSKTEIVPSFVGGIDRSAAEICLKEIDQSQCKLNTQFTEYKHCVKKVLMKNTACKQSLAFFSLTDGGIFKKIRSYQNIDVILADYVYIADQGTGYFLVTKRGEFISLPIPITKKQLKAMPNYSNIAKQYHRVGAWQILNFPDGHPLPDKRYRLVFAQQLKDGCNACAIAGKAEVGYDFSLDGTKFFGIQLLNLYPKQPPQPPI